ncbi:sensor histidine kinase [Flavobacterium rakeshii]|uniref:sensor histidine kinase n=1 Tax=Flavobacterium rakeshii TaxID=1038845 RepID=UPI002E7B2012|nr:sensor histidine kinase [Flavobacterium rakeshii]MEE1898474.1 sensor histidine kinase [Flavobacterium rakeshii]
MAITVMGMTYAQQPGFKEVENDINENRLELATQKLKLLEKDTTGLENRAWYHLLKAKIYDYKYIDSLALQNYMSARDLYNKAGLIDQAIQINLNIAYLIKSQKNSDKLNPEKYLNEYLDYARKSNDSLKLAKAYIEIASTKISYEESEESYEYFQKAKQINKKLGNKELESQINNNLAALYNDFLNKPDSALFYLKKDLIYLKSKPNNNYDICTNYINQAASYYYLGNYTTSIQLLKSADSIPINEYPIGIKSVINKILSLNYAEKNDYKKAYEAYIEYKSFEDSISAQEQSLTISEMETKYQTREKELQNEVLTNEVKTGKILVYIFIGLLIASLVIGFLIIKNARRRVHISKQEKLIEQQKLEKALKEFELNSIDLMLEGQEKERERIANDLHDNLGSMLATLKMNFEHLRMRKNEIREEEDKLYDRTDQLIEDAYQKVRTIAHAKNAGVFANEGLIPAIRKMAGKISIPGKLTIEVLAVGFNKRLENKIEIAIFRMVQELSTNIIKHSKATEASIQLTNHDDNINIIIEDNGVGFKSTTAPSSDGMGLNTITKKVEQLGGTFTIDSTPGKGTTIIIDLPI